MPSETSDRPATAADRLSALRSFVAILDLLRKSFPKADDGDLASMIRGAHGELETLSLVWPDKDDAEVVAAARELAASPLGADLLHRLLTGPEASTPGDPEGGAPGMPFVPLRPWPPAAGRDGGKGG